MAPLPPAAAKTNAGSTHRTLEHRRARGEGAGSANVARNLALETPFFETPGRALKGLRRSASFGSAPTRPRIREEGSPSPENTRLKMPGTENPGRSNQALKEAYAKDHAHVPWTSDAEKLPQPVGPPPDHQALVLGAMSSRNDRQRVRTCEAALAEAQQALGAKNDEAARLQAELEAERRVAEAQRKRGAATERALRVQLEAAVYESSERAEDGERLVASRNQ